MLNWLPCEQFDTASAEYRLLCLEQSTLEEQFNPFNNILTQKSKRKEKPAHKILHTNRFHLKKNSSFKQMQ